MVDVVGGARAGVRFGLFLRGEKALRVELRSRRLTGPDEATGGAGGAGVDARGIDLAVIDVGAGPRLGLAGGELVSLAQLRPVPWQSVHRIRRLPFEIR